jgi:hypothetical protein
MLTIITDQEGAAVRFREFFTCRQSARHRPNIVGPCYSDDTSGLAPLAGFALSTWKGY